MREAATFSILHPLLEEMIGVQSVSGNATENIRMIDLLSQELTKLGFSVTVEGQAESDQPAIVARRAATDCERKLVVYGHYDVVAADAATQTWKNKDPFVLEEFDGRLYGRGIADNKGPLWARIVALQRLIAVGKPCPEILWLIQGEEEVDRTTRVAKAIFSKHLAAFDGSIFVEETGFYDLEKNEQIAFLWSPGRDEKQLSIFQPLLDQSLGKTRLEHRHLNKLTGRENCPLLANLPEHAVYIGFGPNDRQHRIHRDNESLNTAQLQEHVTQFGAFLSSYAGIPGELLTRGRTS